MMKLREMGRVLGGGPWESAVRMFGHQSQIGDLDPTFTNMLIQFFDRAFQVPLFMASHLVPDLGKLDSINYAANGFDISWNLMAIHTVTVLAYVTPVLVCAFVFFKIREVAK